MIKLNENPTQMDFESMRQLLESTMKPWLLEPLS
jgi:hypothetical protein